jgi:hypothetical protein
MFGFSSIGHAFATVFHDISKGAKAVESALVKVAANEAVIEGITSVVYPPAVLIERAAFATLGKVAAAVHDAGPMADANGLNIQLDAALVADIRDLIATVKGNLAAVGVMSKPPAQLGSGGATSSTPQ